MPPLSVPKLLAILGGCVLLTACVLFATRRNGGHREAGVKPPAGTSPSVRAQTSDGVHRGTTGEALDGSRRTGGSEPGRQTETPPRTPAPSGPARSPVPDSPPMETFELPRLPNLKTIREQALKTPMGPAAAPAPRDNSGATAAEELKQGAPAAPASAPTQPTPASSTPAPATPDPVAQAKALRTRLQAYAGEVERLEKNLELVPATPENGGLREKLRLRVDAARRRMQDAQTQLDALAVKAKSED